MKYSIEYTETGSDNWIIFENYFDLEYVYTELKKLRKLIHYEFRVRDIKSNFIINLP